MGKKFDSCKSARNAGTHLNDASEESVRNYVEESHLLGFETSVARTPDERKFVVAAELALITDLAMLNRRHGFSSERARFNRFVNRLSEAMWSYRRRANPDAAPPRRKQKHFLKILINRAARGKLRGWQNNMTLEDAVNLGVGGLSHLSGEIEPAALHSAAHKALERMNQERGGAPRADPARDFWFRSLIAIFESGTGKKAAASVNVAADGSDVPGPFLRFVADASEIAKIDFCAILERSKLARLIHRAHSMKRSDF